MNGIRLAGLLGAAALALLTLAACESEGSGPPLAGQPITGAPQACPRIYDPVCGDRYGDTRTFPNSCEAGAAGYNIRYQGQCRAQPGGPAGPAPGGDYGAPPQGGASGGGQMCPMIYQPVCGRQGNQTRTFPNDCQARNAGYQVLYQSECLGNDAGGQGNGAGQGPQTQPGAGQAMPGQVTPGAVPPVTGDAGAGAGPTGVSPGAAQAQKPAGGQSCSRTFVPVCGKKGSEQKTFINACMAQSEGYTVGGQGRCQ